MAIGNILLVIGALLISVYLFSNLKTQINTNRFKIMLFKNQEKEMFEIIGKRKILFKMINKIAIKISYFNDKNIYENFRYAVLLILIFIFSDAIFVILMTVNSNARWYFYVLYFFIGSIGILIILSLLTRIMRENFLKNIPDAIIVINSRLIREKNIVDALRVSLDDMPKKVFKDMRLLYNAFNKNNKRFLDETLNALDSKYKQKHFSFLLLIMNKTYEIGCQDYVMDLYREEFSNVMDFIDMRKDLSAAYKGYLGMSLISPLFLFFADRFNENNLYKLGISQIEDSMSHTIKIITFVVLFIYI